ncbi:RNA polymerase sigma factor [Wenjunlia tyrosinilytica]|uniref:DNA-directed RNA polymerase sigma-70 factor n=1 Tax=Wenjunlia tyrosinilytica TaxID=1544741 RepID=A0A918DZN2_9ACTN|nr:sigma-70 family RNA polymerase sigma factor [Wenjunlia tyrosinilytica]GGO90636.1 DNA-directed RNA polymerase sigma-70 factor [Wenjunlia tyrosinilytica]
MPSNDTASTLAEPGSGGRPSGHPGASVAAARWELLLSHRERLHRLAGSRLLCRQDVEDCVQEALLRAATFSGLDESRVGPFLTSVTLRLCTDFYRRGEQHRRLLLRIHLSETAAGPEETVCAASEGAWVLEQVGRLDGRERQVILARVNGVSTREAARSLGISTKAAEGAFTRARARLRRWYGDSLAS